MSESQRESRRENQSQSRRESQSLGPRAPRLTQGGGNRQW